MQKPSVLLASGLASELGAIMARYDAESPPDDENGMAAPVMLGPEYVRLIIGALQSGNVTAKPLIWDGFGLEMWADSIAGRYYISGHGSRWSWTFDDDDPFHHGESVGSECEAKGAAQRHFDALVSAAITKIVDA